MIETEITITVNRKSDIEQVQQKIIENKIRFPVYIREFEYSYQINFTSDYEEWEMDTAILSCFPDYEYTTDLERGRKEIRIQIFRYQSELSTDGWGRPIENPLNETKYLVKKSINKSEKFNPKIKVLFEDKEEYYYVNIVNGINKATDEKGFLLLDNFKSKNEDDNAELLKDRLYQSPLEAFHSGFYKMQELVDTDFGLYLENKRKEIKDIQKVPRKIVRDFINSCNNSNEDGILKNINELLMFEKRVNWKTVVRAEGISAFKEYLNSSDQQLCGRNFKIRTSWSFNLPAITIGVKYFPVSSSEETIRTQKYGQIKFTIVDGKITSIIDES